MVWLKNSKKLSVMETAYNHGVQMKIKYFLLASAVTQIISSVSVAAIPVSNSDLYKQLTGKTLNTTTTQKKSQKIIASADKALMLARQSRDEKNYIQAIKRYNFILKYYSKTNHAKLALVDKSMMYKEMGLPVQAAYNQKKVLQINALSKMQVVPNNKLIKR
jgi:hypothetical protein